VVTQDRRTNRLVYYVTDDHVVILQTRDHYWVSPEIQGRLRRVRHRRVFPADPGLLTPVEVEDIYYGQHPALTETPVPPSGASGHAGAIHDDRTV
jgi:hypothetical protein